MAEEEWRAIPGYDDAYEASSYGRIRRSKPSMTKSGGEGGWKAGYIISQADTKEGYKRCNLWLVDRQRSRYVHRLVCIAFHGEPPSLKHTVNHKDGNKINNAPSNLEWATKSENYRHALDVLGFQPNHSGNHWNAKKGEMMVRLIRHRVANGESQSSVARDLGVPRSNVSLIVRRLSWAHVH